MFLKVLYNSDENMRTKWKHIWEIRMFTQIKKAALSSSETVIYDLAGIVSLVVVFFASLHLPALF